MVDRTLKSNYYYYYYYLHYRGLSPDPEQHPQSEDYWGHVNPIGPRACYDEGKRVAETMCYAYKKQVCVTHSVCQLLILARYLARVIYKLCLNSRNTKYSQNVTCVCKNILSVKHMLLECPIITELFQKNGYDLNVSNNVRDILYNTDVITNIVKSIVDSPVGKLI